MLTAKELVQSYQPARPKNIAYGYVKTDFPKIAYCIYKFENFNETIDWKIAFYQEIHGRLTETKKVAGTAPLAVVKHWAKNHGLNWLKEKQLV